jgi:hypothetical protein
VLSTKKLHELEAIARRENRSSSDILKAIAVKSSFPERSYLLFLDNCARHAVGQAFPDRGLLEDLGNAIGHPDGVDIWNPSLGLQGSEVDKSNVCKYFADAWLKLESPAAVSTSPRESTSNERERKAHEHAGLKGN